MEDISNRDLTLWAIRAMQLFKEDMPHPLSDEDRILIAESVAITTAKQAKRLNMSWKEVVRWLQNNYGKVWVIESGLRPGMDLKDISQIMEKIYQ